MNTQLLKEIGFSDNEIKIYLCLLESGTLTAYEIGKKTSIYRAHIYDKLEKLIDKGFVSSLYQSSKKFYQATSPNHIMEYLNEKKNEIIKKEEIAQSLIKELSERQNQSKEDTEINIFKGIEGIKYFLKDIIKEKKEVLISGIDERKYQEALPIYMEQYFRDLRNYKIKEKVITMKKENVVLFKKKTASTTEYRFLKEPHINPTNTFVYGNKVVIVSWNNPPTAVMMENKNLAETYSNQFKYLWKIASKK